MINCARFTWYHLPRTGGTATARWIRQASALLNVAIEVDPCDTPAKHDNLLTRKIRNPGFATGPISAMNFKRLGPWLQSTYRFAKAKGLDVDEARYMKGEFFSLRTGRWCAADWWLDYFSIETIDVLFPDVDLETAWRAFLLHHLGRHVPDDLHFGRENEVGVEITVSPDWRLMDFSDAHERNPRWTALENRLFVM